MKLKNIKLKVTILSVLFILCAIISPISTNVNAALATHVTGDDIISAGKELEALCRSGYFTYTNIGTCTGFVTRVANHLNFGSDVIGIYFPNGDGWNTRYTYEAKKGPNAMYNAAEAAVARGDAIRVVTRCRKSDIGQYSELLRNGDLIITRENVDRPEGQFGHVAYIHIEDGVIYSFGAGTSYPYVKDSKMANYIPGAGINSLSISELDGGVEPYSEGGDDYVRIYRLVADEQYGNLKLVKKDTNDQYVEGVEFEITGDKLEEPIRTTTDANGEINIESMKVGLYTAREVSVPANMILKTEEIPFEIKVNETSTIEVLNEYPYGKIVLEKYDSLDGKENRGDSTFLDAEYTIYARENIVQGKTTLYTAGQEISKLVTNKDGHAESSLLPVGKYYVKETKAPKGYELDDKTYNVEITHQNSISSVATTESIESSDSPINGRARVVKFNNDKDSSEKHPAEGAVLRLTLISSKTGEVPDGTYYEITLDKNGEGEFIDEKFREKHPNEESTIPYGKYEIREIAESEDSALTHYFIQPKIFEVEESNKLYAFTLSDEIVDSYMKIVKVDEVTGETIEKEGAKFKIWDVEAGEFVEFMEPISAKPITELGTSDKGYLNTPDKLKAGKKYIVYETAAPEGYVINPKYALPENKSEYGKKNGYEVVLNKESLGVTYDIEYDKDETLILLVKIEDPRPMVKLKIYKTGEMFTNISQTNAPDPLNDSGAQLYTPVFTKEKLPGVAFSVIAMERVLNPDKSGNYVEAGTVVDNSIITNEDGIGTSIELFPGTYKVVETDAPIGTVIDTKGVSYTLENDGKETPVKVYEKELTNVRQKLGLTFPKRFDEVKFKLGEDYEEEPQATFAVYASEAIRTVKNNKEIPKNGLVDVITVKGNGDVTTNIDLPQGKYYVKEIAASFPYTINPEPIDFELKYGEDKTQEYKIANGETFTNKAETATVTLIKVSTSSMQSVLIDGENVDQDSIKEEMKNMLEKIQNMTKDEVKEYFKENDIKAVPGATYGIYLDEDCTQILKIQNDVTKEYEDAKIVTDESGMITLENIPLGEYYVKELVAPKGYKPSTEIVKVVLTAENQDGTLYTALKEDKVVDGFIKKTDMFDGDTVPNCIFTITKENGEEILYSKTSDKGIAYIPADALVNGEKYFFTEISAPEEYELNTTPHPFTAQIKEVDGELVWDGEIHKVENTRKSKELRILKIDEKTGEPLKGCVFSIALLDKDGNVKTREDGSVVYLVENAVTDENGEYLIEKAYYGTYKFTEVQAPEGYELNEKDMEGYVFTIDENSADRIDFVITNTGDIAVIAIAVVAVVCVIGIAFVIIKNKKARK